MSEKTQPIPRRRDSAPGPTPPAPDDRSRESAGSSAKFRMPPRRTLLTFLIILTVNYLIMRLLAPTPDAAITVPYTTFKQQVSDGNVEEIYSKGAGIEGLFKKAVTWPPPDAAPETQPQPTGLAALVSPDRPSRGRRKRS